MSATVIARLTDDSPEAKRVLETVRELVTGVEQIGPLDYELWFGAPDVDLGNAVTILRGELDGRLTGWSRWISFPGAGETG
jgi:hypothetical protein